jgi:hypothetical protein
MANSLNVATAAAILLYWLTVCFEEILGAARQSISISAIMKTSVISDDFRRHLSDPTDPTVAHVCFGGRGGDRHILCRRSPSKVAPWSSTVGDYHRPRSLVFKSKTAANRLFWEMR